MRKQMGKHFDHHHELLKGTRYHGHWHKGLAKAVRSNPALSGFKSDVEAGEYAFSHPLNALAAGCRRDADKWYRNPKTGRKIKRNFGECIALEHSELSEVLEGYRKGEMDKHLPHRTAEEVETADLLIRVFDRAGERGYDLDAVVAEKRAYNRTRADHTAAARLAKGGKKFKRS